jgi:hypothetical protein
MWTVLPIPSIYTSELDKYARICIPEVSVFTCSLWERPDHVMESHVSERCFGACSTQGEGNNGHWPQKEYICPAHHKESLERDEPSKAPPVKPSPNSDNARPIVCRPMGLPVTAGNDTAWDRTQGCSHSATLQCSALDRCATREVWHGFF